MACQPRCQRTSFISTENRPEHSEVRVRLAISMGVKSEKSSASYGSFPKKGTGDRREFDFKICDIILDTDEDDPVADFVSDLAKNVKRWSRLAELDECSVEQDHNSYVAKVSTVWCSRYHESARELIFLM